MKIEDLFSDSFQQLRASFQTTEGLLQPMVGKMLSPDSRFCKEAVAAGQISQEEMQRAVLHYRLGKSRSGETVFWMIDQNQRVRDAIVSNSWASVLLKKRGLIDQQWCPQHCLFGLHLLSNTYFTFNEHGDEHDNEHESHESNELNNHSCHSCDSCSKNNLTYHSCHSCDSCSTNQLVVCIVESVQSCVVLSERFPKYLWMATGYLANLNEMVFLPLKGHRVICHPATDPTGDTYLLWLSVATAARKYGLDITVSRLLEDQATPDQKSRKIDLVDFLFPHTDESDVTRKSQISQK